MVCVSRNASIKICLSGFFPLPLVFSPKQTWLGPEGVSSLLLQEGGYDAAVSGADYLPEGYAPLPCWHCGQPRGPLVCLARPHPWGAFKEQGGVHLRSLSIRPRRRPPGPPTHTMTHIEQSFRITRLRNHTHVYKHTYNLS